MPKVSKIRPRYIGLRLKPNGPLVTSFLFDAEVGMISVSSLAKVVLPHAASAKPKAPNAKASAGERNTVARPSKTRSTPYAARSIPSAQTGGGIFKTQFGFVCGALIGQTPSQPLQTCTKNKYRTVLLASPLPCLL